MKRKAIIVFISFILFFSIFVNNVYASEGCQWYIKHGGKNPPIFPSETDEIEKYNVYYVDKNALNNDDKVIYLTFDAGYENGNIEKILDTLKTEEIKSAFFLLDNIIIKNTDLVKRMAEEGHLVCNHTLRHRDLSFENEQTIQKDLSSLEELYTEKTGYKMEKFFRFPAGRYSIDALKTVSELGYTTVFWSFAYDDWDNNRQMNKERAFNKIIENTHNGAIILLHPTSNVNAELLPQLINKWREMGYRFGTLSELINK